MTTTPVEGTCARCKQPRPVFIYKPLHDCIESLSAMEDTVDRWCLARTHREGRLRLCVPCHDREVADEEHCIKENEL
jgi:hypothetical protein